MGRLHDSYHFRLRVVGSDVSDVSDESEGGNCARAPVAGSHGREGFACTTAKKSEITDWLIATDGEPLGGFTVALLQ